MKKKPEQVRESFKRQLESTRLYTYKPISMTFQEWRSIVSIGYVGMVGDLFHAGHVNILQFAKVYCQIVVVGVLTDEAVRSYKRIPVINFEERARIISLSEMADIVIPQNKLDYRENLHVVRPNYLFHGKDWRKGVQSTVRNQALEMMESFEGVLIEPDPYGGVSTTGIIHHIKEHR